jgi:hypothetical protein
MISVLPLYNKNNYGNWTKVSEAIVDSDMIEVLKNYRWRLNYDGYPISDLCGKTVKLHWMIIGKPISDFVVDHIDLNPLNSQRSNLRIVTKRQNITNTNRSKLSKYPGVSWCKDRKQWISRITINCKLFVLGRFINELNAFSCYRSKVHNLGEVLLPEHEELYLVEIEKKRLNNKYGIRVPGDIT